MMLKCTRIAAITRVAMATALLDPRAAALKKQLGILAFGLSDTVNILGKSRGLHSKGQVKTEGTYTKLGSHNRKGGLVGEGGQRGQVGGEGGHYPVYSKINTKEGNDMVRRFKTESSGGVSRQGAGGGVTAGGGEREEGSIESGELSKELEGLLEGLCEEQCHVLKLVLGGKSVFFTGAAGTGKSFLLKKIHQALTLKEMAGATFMTGTTGKAAVGIGGCTVHSFAGIGLGNQPIEQLLSHAQRSRNAKKRWAACKVLVIDEISMMDANLFDKLNIVGQRMKGDSRPFGGVQLVLCGDFFQLPPVGIGSNGVNFCFEAKTWESSLDQCIVLKQVFRQKDPRFLSILHEMREGKISNKSQSILHQKVQDTRHHRQWQATRAAQAAKGGERGEDPGTGDVTEVIDDASGATGEKAVVEVHCGVEGKPEVTGGAVLPTKLFSRNMDVDRLNNSELQRLTGERQLYHADDRGEEPYLKQLQNHCAAPALLELKVGSKVLLLKNVDASSQLVNGATGVIIDMPEASGRKLPVVKFDPMEGHQPVTATIREEEWTISVGDKQMATRTQIPLRLAWALSVHKAQGMTIPHVEVSMQGMFEYGQAYVALSRATTMDGLHLLDFDPRVVRAHTTVKSFYARLEERSVKGSSSVTSTPRTAQPPPSKSEWIPRAHHPSQSLESSSGAVTETSQGPEPRTSEGDNGAWGRSGARGGVVGGLSPEVKARMELNKRIALTKLAEKRAKALKASRSLDHRQGGEGEVIDLN